MQSETTVDRPIADLAFSPDGDHDSTAPLPAGVTDAGDDRGEPARRATLRAPAVLPETLGWTLEGARVGVNGTLLALPAPAVAVSPDGRW